MRSSASTIALAVALALSAVAPANALDLLGGLVKLGHNSSSSSDIVSVTDNAGGTSVGVLGKNGASVNVPNILGGSSSGNVPLNLHVSVPGIASINTGGSGGGGTFNPRILVVPGANGGTLVDTGDGSFLANSDTSNCVTLSPAQIDQLEHSRTYNGATFNSWAGANKLKVIPMHICSTGLLDVSMTMAADANVEKLQSFLARQQKIRAGLQSQGYAPTDVIAADRDGNFLLVWVI